MCQSFDISQNFKYRICENPNYNPGYPENTWFYYRHLIVEDLDPLEDVVLDEAVEDGPVNLAEELAGVELVLGDDDKAVVVEHVALHGVVLAGDLVPAL